MDFDFTDDQEIAARRRAPLGRQGLRLRAPARLAKAGGFTREVWRELAELGLTGLAVPEAHGGMGFGAGRGDGGDGRARPRPGQRAVRAGRAGRAGAAGGSARRLAGRRGCRASPTAGAGRAGARRSARARYRLDHVETTAHAAAAATGCSSGTKSVVPAGDEADAFIVPARVGGAVDDAAGIGLFLVERGRRRQVRGYPTQDGARAADLVLDGSAAPS